eukprot:evm.model.NODE_4407_length_63659_cov_22.504595.25
MATQTVLCGRDGEAEEEAGEGVEDCGQQAEEEREEGEKEEVAVEVPKRVEEEIAEAEEAAVVVEEEEDLEEKEEDASSMTCDDQQGGWGVVQSLWPRAQVKAFGSFVSGLALPSSDVDLVICLPKEDEKEATWLRHQSRA